MRLGLIADLHANLPALEAVAADMDRHAIDNVLVAGDLVGYYSDVNEVIDFVRQRRWIAVRGNHDEMVLGMRSVDAGRAGAYRTEWTSRELSPDHRTWLASLPAQRTLDLSGLTVLLCHGSPWDSAAYVYPSFTEWTRFDDPSVDVVVMGHTHHPLSLSHGRALLLNPGSCGQPRDRDPRASWMSLDLASREVRRHRAAYDVAALQCRLRAEGLDPMVVDILSREGA